MVWCGPAKCCHHLGILGSTWKLAQDPAKVEEVFLATVALGVLMSNTETIKILRLCTTLMFGDIQEFYEVTLLNSQKSYEQKIEEANQVAEKWEKTKSSTTCHESLQRNHESAASSGSNGSVLCDEHNKENQSFENHSANMKTKQSHGRCPSHKCSVEAPAWMPIQHTAP
ncbi:hypothetical protein Y1Q_0003445 [Alligator mississippiensis]|uniref:Uncharacterized protein n=1 Tax=Alligator mississippiensis TaxID=8496 RepID=A0A151N5L7_ALLMI|nr:hypothetical protein Y1Q_0003445 [Alligator mississippiensis]